VRTLVAEPDTLSRRVLETALTQWGHEVTVCSDGTEACQVIQSQGAPELAILEWTLPGMDGLQVCGEVKKAAQLIPYTILLASPDLQQDPMQGLEAGADDCLTKPVDASQLHLRLRLGQRVLEMRRELIDAREQLRRKEAVDLLTGLWSRSTLFEQLARELPRARREGAPLGVVLVDLDDFKSINDAHGYRAGDAVLREVAQRLRRSLRPYDSLGRYGGDEFLLVLPGCDFHGAVNVAERVRACVAAAPVKLERETVPVTVSAGVSAVSNPAEMKDADAFIRATETALYEARQPGRDRVKVAANGAFVNISA
jgi:diguanylate cyclase (GGDEF)-like protein